MTDRLAPSELLRAARERLGWSMTGACACAGEVVERKPLAADGPFCGIISLRRLRRCERGTERIPPQVWPVLSRALHEYDELHHLLYPDEAREARRLVRQIMDMQYHGGRP